MWTELVPEVPLSLNAGEAPLISGSLAQQEASAAAEEEEEEGQVVTAVILTVVGR